MADEWQPATHWLVKYPDREPIVMPDDLFLDWADRVKYDGIEYEAEPLRCALQSGETK